MIVFVDVLGFGITIPVLPLYAQDIFGATATEVALIASVYFAAQFVAAPQLGRLSDRIGRRPVLILSQAGSFAALLLNGAAPSLAFIYLARVIDGLTGGNISVAQAYLSDITDERNRARGLGIINAAFSTGFTIGPAFGAFVASQFGPRVPFFIGAVVSLATISLSFFLLPESLTPERRQRDAAARAHRASWSRFQMLRSPAVLLIVLIALLVQFAFFGFQSLYVLWMDHVVLAGNSLSYIQQAVGLIFTLTGIIGILSQAWLVGPLVRRFKERTLVRSGVLLTAIAFLLMALFPSLPPVVATGSARAVANGFSQPALVALLTYAAPPGQRGLAIGVLESFQSLGRILGPILAGILFEQVNPTAPIAAAAVVTGLAFVLTLGLGRVQSERPRGAPRVALETSQPASE